MVDLRLENGERDGNGVQTKAPKRVELTYDQSDFMTRQLNLGTTAACEDDERTDTTYFDTGWERQRTMRRGDAGCGADSSAWKLRQTTGWTHFDNGKLRTLTTKDGNGRTTEAHDIGYFSGGRYEDGNRVTDSYLQLTSEDAPTPRPAAGRSARPRRPVRPQVRPTTPGARSLVDQIGHRLAGDLQVRRGGVPGRRPDAAGGNVTTRGEAGGRPRRPTSATSAPG